MANRRLKGSNRDGWSYKPKYFQGSGERSYGNGRCRTKVRHLAQSACRFILAIRVIMRRDLQQERQRK